jgi:hypothetical protein
MRSHRSRAARRACRVLVTAVVSCATVAALASAGQSARLEVGLVPDRLGQDTTIEFGFRITASGGGVPSPVTRIELRYPKHIGIVTSGLGLASCASTLLEALGPEGCPSRSLMGYGTATAEVDVGGEIVEELASTAIFMGPLAEGNINLEFFVNGETPLAASLVFPGRLLPAVAPYGGDLSITVPLLENFPEGPYVSLVKLRSTIGPLGVIYYARVHGKFVPYQPTGITLPSTCPKHGFPFEVTFAFADGSTTTSHASVPCPRTRRRRGP